MINRPDGRDHYPDRLARVRDLVSRDDPGLASELVSLATANDDVWRFDGAQVRMAVETLPPTRRHDLILEVAAAAAATPIESLLHWLGRHFSAAELSRPAGSVLINAATRRTTGVPAELAVLAEVALRDTGRVPPELLAVMRRSARWMPPLAADIRPFLTDPADLLNVGEPWAETANTAAASDERIRALIAHALRSRGAAPATRWSTKAVELTSAFGRAESRALLHHWFALVPQDRTFPLRGDFLYDVNDVPDTHNAEALRGLLHLIAATRPEPGDAEAVGRLAQYASGRIPGHGPRSPIVTNAAILALESIGTRTALTELRRLRTAAPMPGTARRLDQAIARRAAALRS
ncbi:hypothetical protein [Actinoplanes sp. OR16]|uniref:hypothetical protein n=1 Tax=Actinoplanes sp. OR16 TaxID=946334 RepID=UPI000FDB6890|nr:hypothetical protein [Actinoplanes sp. OR16]